MAYDLAKANGENVSEIYFEDRPEMYKEYKTTNTLEGLRKEFDNVDKWYKRSSDQFKAMQEELEELRRTKVSNSDLYYRVQDKWMERIYQAIHKILTPEQWARFNKNGNGRDKKERDKRMKKAQGL